MMEDPLPGFTESPSLQCEAKTPARWYRPEPGRCPFKARYINGEGRKLCRRHAVLVAKAAETRRKQDA